MKGGGDANLPLRHAARIILLDSDNNTLLLRYVDDSDYIDPNDPDLIDYWVTPGGGVETGESLEQTAERELREETGFGGIELDGLVARRRYELLIRGVRTLCLEHLFIARHHGVKPTVDTSGQLPDELAVLRDVRWWSSNELRVTGDVILPTCLDQLIGRWLAGSLGSTPLELT